MLALLFLIPALTLNVGFTIAPDCPANITLDAPPVVALGSNVTIAFHAEGPLQYSIIDEDNTTIVEWKTVSGAVMFKPAKTMLHRYVRVLARSAIKGCAHVAGNTTLEVQRQTAPSTTTFHLPATASVVPWMIVGLATILAAVLIWKR